MEMSTKDNGRMIKLMVLEPIHIWMVLNMKVIGLKINNMGKELKLGLMELDMKDNIIWEKNMEVANFIGQTVHYMKVIFTIIIFTAREHMNGLMEENILEIGKIIKWMAKVYLPGQMVENIMVNIRMIKNTVLVFLNGQMEENIKEIGKMVNNMEKVHILALTALKEKVNGMKEKELGG